MTPGARHHGGSGSNEDMKTYSVYIMASSSGVLYIGITNDLERRAAEHKKKLVPGFSARYNVSKLVYFELFGNVHAAIAREKQLKGWLRKRKIALIESVNPQWNDLSAQSHPPIVRHSAPLTASQSKPVVARHSAPVTAPHSLTPSRPLAPCHSERSEESLPTPHPLTPCHSERSEESLRKTNQRQTLPPTKRDSE